MMKIADLSLRKAWIEEGILLCWDDVLFSKVEKPLVVAIVIDYTMQHHLSYGQSSPSRLFSCCQADPVKSEALST